MLFLKNISKALGQFALKSINLEIAENEYFVILGPSGAGKTVLLELIAGLCSPDQGVILLHGQDMIAQSPEQRNIGLVYQNYALFPHLDVWHNIAFGLRLKKIPGSEVERRVDEISTLLKITRILKRNTATLSGGEQQRVALARALVLNPGMILLDEPLSALDAHLREQLRQELKQLQRLTKTTIIHVTHDFEEAVFLADRIAVMNEGQIVQVGMAEEIFHFPTNQFVARFAGIKNVFKGALTEAENGLQLFQSGDFRLIVNTDLKDEAHISILPEDIILSKEQIHSSARNSLPGFISDIIPQGRLMEVVVDAGKNIAVLITAQSLRDMELKKDQQIWITFKSSAVHVF
ncbi:ABC transporter ATP-binding protein [Candidatus Margulisiibacteriota bacterium]